MNFFSARYSRRDILKIATSSALVTTSALLSNSCSQKKADLETVAKKMTEVLNHPLEARKIGEQYLAQAPSYLHKSYEQLTRELLVILNLHPEDIPVETLPSLDTRLSAQVRQDFVDENIVIIDNWMLSRTEVMLCVLAASLT